MERRAPRTTGFLPFPRYQRTGAAFQSEATNLDPDDTDATEDVFVRDLVTNDTTLVSRADGATGATGNAFSGVPSISGNGRQVAFISTSTNLGDDGDSITDVFVRELLTNETTLVSRDTGVSGVKGNADSNSPAISENGRYVAFDSEATNLGGQTDIPSDVLIRDQQTNTTTLVSRTERRCRDGRQLRRPCAIDLRHRAPRRLPLRRDEPRPGGHRRHLQCLHSGHLERQHGAGRPR